MGASDFPRLLWMWPLPTFIGKWKKKQNQKEFPSCFIPCLLVVFTHKRELSIIGISLFLLKDFHVLWVMYYSKEKDWTLKCLKCLLQGDKNNWKFQNHLTSKKVTVAPYERGSFTRDSSCSDSVGKILMVFFFLLKWGGRQWEDWCHMEVWLKYFLLHVSLMKCTRFCNCCCQWNWPWCKENDVIIVYCLDCLEKRP